jgi:hypothetical protein
MPFSKPANWVARRAEAERSLAKFAPDAWNKIRSEIQDACDTFNLEYRGSAVTVDCKPENGHRILVVINNGQQRSDVVIAFKKDSAAIEVSDPSGHASFPLRWVGDGGGVVVVSPDGERVNDLSRFILEPLLFPKEPQLQ